MPHVCTHYPNLLHFRLRYGIIDSRKKDPRNRALGQKKSAQGGRRDSQMKTSTTVYFKLWNTLDPKKQKAALLAIKDRLLKYVESKVKEMYQDATTEVCDHELGLSMTVCSNSGEFPNGNLGEAVREFLADCNDPQLKGFQLVTDIGAATSSDVVGGGRNQLYGFGLPEIDIRTEF